MTKTRKLGLILLLSFILGVAITVAEPDLQVLATNVPNIDKTVLIATVSVGVGIFLMISMLRILFAVPLKWMLVAFYAVVFILAALSDQDFLSVAFDSGGVASGPMTSTFVLPFCIGFAFAGGQDVYLYGFGLVSLVAMMPLIVLQALGLTSVIKAKRALDKAKKRLVEEDDDQIIHFQTEGA